MEAAELNNDVPDTGISGVYEICYGTNDPEFAIKYFAEFGFHVIKDVQFSNKQAASLYGYNSKLRSIRLQNGKIDSHGLIRLFVWETFKHDHVPMSPPRTIGQRLAVMKTNDIFRLQDVFTVDRQAGQQWAITKPIADDLFDLDGGKKDLFNRPIIVRENAVYGSFFNHIFFQRYGYHIEGYGTIDPSTPLQTSEFTHHDFFIKGKSLDQMAYLSTALGLHREAEAAIDGEWQKGPKAVFKLEAGQGHWYQGFVSPNNICGKLKMFIPTNDVEDRSDIQQVGDLGITLHTFYTKKLDMVYSLVMKHGLNPTSKLENEFNEHCFTFTCPAGCSWQIIQKQNIIHKPETELKFKLTKR